MVRTTRATSDTEGAGGASAGRVTDEVEVGAEALGGVIVVVVGGGGGSTGAAMETIGGGVGRLFTTNRKRLGGAVATGVDEERGEEGDEATAVADAVTLALEFMLALLLG